jgi:hypothetical protein
MFFHRLTSNSNLAVFIMENGQGGRIEDLFVSGYRALMRRPSEELFREITTIFDQQLHRPKRLLIIAAHFGLAHQIAVIKKRLEKEKNVQVKLVVQVTDDTSQHIWYVPGADLTVVPSTTTQQRLSQYGREAHLPKIKIEVAPYPISPILATSMTIKEFALRKEQLDPTSNTPIELSIPISGAAVGLSFDTALIHTLANRRFHFNVVSRQSSYTDSFLNFIKKLPHVHLFSSGSDREVVDLYEEMFERHVISLEITKPSEQVFKVLYTPRQKGGALLLLSQPIGRQEWDNVAFLRRHLLMPSEELESTLWNLADKNEEIPIEIFTASHYWRALKLPKSATDSAHFINWALKEKLFLSMLSSVGRPSALDTHKHELGSDGVAQFWKKVAALS